MRQLGLETATEIASQVRAGTVSAVDVARTMLDRIGARDVRIGAFQYVPPAEEIVAEARAVDAHPARATLRLAGVPIAIKDNLAVRGMPMRNGSLATSEQLCQDDHEVVKRLRNAGALIVGKTRVPELCIWGTTDSAFGTTRNPWNLERTPGGSSGGSAAAVAAGMVPLAIGNDGLGSIRIPAACCGLFGIKPGYGTVPAQLGPNDWYGFVENGPLATNAADAALALAVMSGRAELADVSEPTRSLKIAVSTKSPAVGIRVDREYSRVTTETVKLLSQLGHRIDTVHPPYSLRVGAIVMAHWVAGAALDAKDLALEKLEARTRAHVRAGRMAQRLGWVGPAHRQWWRGKLEPLFSRYDLLLTPALAAPPIAADAWSRKSWLANLNANLRYAPFAAAWNFAGFPAASIPSGMHSAGTPLAVQIVGRPGGESLILSLAAQLERARPWPRLGPV